jgi:hypothetical protein
VGLSFTAVSVALLLAIGLAILAAISRGGTSATGKEGREQHQQVTGLGTLQAEHLTSLPVLVHDAPLHRLPIKSPPGGVIGASFLSSSV